jgi:hypothetical protein
LSVTAAPHTVTIPQSVLETTAKWMVDFRDYWHDEVPTKIHTAAFDSGGTPAWHSDFERWLGIDWYGKRSDDRWERNPEPRIRTTRAFRKLRKKAVREYEVCYRIIILGEPISETAKWLNDRAIRNGKTDRYGILETMLILISGVGKMISWW